MTRTEELLALAESAANRNNTGEAVRIIIDILQEVAAGTLSLTRGDPKDDLKDDIAFFEGKAAKAAARGDTQSAKKNSERAKMLKAAETLVAKKEDNK